jgi:prepilin signal peptidase PulO-like enzyme (type II secretory pathway)
MATVGANGALIARSSAVLAIVILGGLTGLLFGSFLNVVIYRVPAGISLSYPPSHCPECKHPISPLENIPVVSWLALRGKCRHCSQPIPLRYPATELATGAAFALAGAIRVVYLSQLRSRSEIATFVLALLAEWTAIAAVIALTGLALENHVPRGRSLLEVSLAQLVLLGIATWVSRGVASGTAGADSIAILAAVAMTAALGAAWIATTRRSRSTKTPTTDQVATVRNSKGLETLLALLLAGSVSASWSAPASLALWGGCALLAYGLQTSNSPDGKNHPLDGKKPRFLGPARRLSILTASSGMLISLIWSGIGAGTLAKWP